MRKKLHFLSLIALIISFISCGMTQSTSKEKSNDAFSTAFILATYELVSIEDLDVTEMQLEMHIDPEQNRISGNSGCNRYGFTYKLDISELDLGYAMATKMYCEETMSIENAFFKAMTKANRFIIDNEKITFTNDEKEVLVTAKTKMIPNE